MSSKSAVAWRKRKMKDPVFRQRERDRVNGLVSRKLKTPLGWSKIALVRIRNRSKREGIPFDLELQDIIDAMPVDGCCPILGVKLKFGCTTNDPDGPSVDRVRPVLGYVKGNIKVISYWGNTIKKDLPSEAIFALAAYVWAAEH